MFLYIASVVGFYFAFWKQQVDANKDENDREKQLCYVNAYFMLHQGFNDIEFVVEKPDSEEQECCSQCLFGEGHKKRVVSWK